MPIQNQRARELNQEVSREMETERVAEKAKEPGLRISLAECPEFKNLKVGDILRVAEMTEEEIVLTPGKKWHR